MCSLGNIELRLQGAATLSLETEASEEPPNRRRALFCPLPLLPRLAFYPGASFRLLSAQAPWTPLPSLTPAPP